MSGTAPQPSTSAPGPAAAAPAAAAAAANGRSSGCPPHVLEVGGPRCTIGVMVQHPSNSETVHGSLGTELQPSPPAAWPLNWLCPAAFPHCLLCCRRFMASKRTRRSSWSAACTAGGQVGAEWGAVLGVCYARSAHFSGCGWQAPAAARPCGSTKVPAATVSTTSKP